MKKFSIIAVILLLSTSCSHLKPTPDYGFYTDMVRHLESAETEQHLYFMMQDSVIHFRIGKNSTLAGWVLEQTFKSDELDHIIVSDEYIDHDMHVTHHTIALSTFKLILARLDQAYKDAPDMMVSDYGVFDDMIREIESLDQAHVYMIVAGVDKYHFEIKDENSEYAIIDLKASLNREGELTFYIGDYFINMDESVVHHTITMSDFKKVFAELPTNYK